MTVRVVEHGPDPQVRRSPFPYLHGLQPPFSIALRDTRRVPTSIHGRNANSSCCPSSRLYLPASVRSTGSTSPRNWAWIGFPHRGSGWCGAGCRRCEGAPAPRGGGSPAQTAPILHPSTMCARRSCRNQVQSILHRNLIPRCPAADLFGNKGRAWLAAQEMPPDEHQAVGALLRQLDFHGSGARPGWSRRASSSAASTATCTCPLCVPRWRPRSQGPYRSLRGSEGGGSGLTIMGPPPKFNGTRDIPPRGCRAR